MNGLKNTCKEWVKKHNPGEKWERNFSAALLAFFVLFGVLFFIFVIPKISPGFFTGGGGKNVWNDQQEHDPAENFSIGVKLSGDKEYSRALEYFQKAAEKDPGNADYLNELAATYYKIKNYDEAVKAYNKLIQIDGGNEGVYANRIANIYWIRKEYDLAETYFRKAIEKDPKAAVSYNNLALMLDEESRKEEAEGILQEGIRNSSGGDELKATLLTIQGKK